MFPRLIDRITRLRGLDHLTGSEMDSILEAETAYYAAQDLGSNEAANRLALSLKRIRDIERNHNVEVQE